MNRVIFWIKLIIHNMIHDPKARRGALIAFLTQGVATVAFPWIGWWGQLFAGFFMAKAISAAIGDDDDDDDDDDDFGGWEDSEYQLEPRPDEIPPGMIAIATRR